MAKFVGMWEGNKDGYKQESESILIDQLILLAREFKLDFHQYVPIIQQPILFVTVVVSCLIVLQLHGKMEKDGKVGYYNARFRGSDGKLEIDLSSRLDGWQQVSSFNGKRHVSDFLFCLSQHVIYIWYYHCITCLLYSSILTILLTTSLF